MFPPGLCPGSLPAGLVQKGLAVGRGVGGVRWVPEPVLRVAGGSAGSDFAAWCLVQDSVPRVLTYRSDLFAETSTPGSNVSQPQCPQS